MPKHSLVTDVPARLDWTITFLPTPQSILMEGVGFVLVKSYICCFSKVSAGSSPKKESSFSCSSCSHGLYKIKVHYFLQEAVKSSVCYSRKWPITWNSLKLLEMHIFVFACLFPWWYRALLRTKYLLEQDNMNICGIAPSFLHSSGSLGVGNPHCVCPSVPRAISTEGRSQGSHASSGSTQNHGITESWNGLAQKGPERLSSF